MFGNDYDKYFDEAGDIYKDYERQALDAITKGETQGRGDIEKGYGEALGYQAPWMKGGLGAFRELMGLSTPQGMQGVYNKFQNAPGYQAALRAGQQSVMQANAARGLAGSGAESRELQETGQNLQNQDWQNWFNQYQGRLSGIAGAGQGAANVSSQLASGRGSGLAQLGYGYTGMRTGVLGDLANMLSQIKMGQGVMNAQQGNDWMQLLGSLGGTILGGPIGGAIGQQITKR